MQKYISSLPGRLLKVSGMLSPRREIILKAIIEQYITKAKPVSSQSLLNDYDLEVSSATIRNEMAFLEEAGFITHPHTSSGKVPGEMGYRHYVESIGDVQLPIDERLQISHIFHQAEKEIEEWVNIAAGLVAQMVKNAVIVTVPRVNSGACRMKHVELVGLTDTMTLIVLVLEGAKVKEQLVNFDTKVTQAELSAMAIRMNTGYSGLNAGQIVAKDEKYDGIEARVNDLLVRLMEAEDKAEFEEPYLDGLHFTLNQPEFARDHRIASALIELIEQRKLISCIASQTPGTERVRVIIGKENKTEAMHDLSIVLANYGVPEEATGLIGVIGPIRMPYARTIATVDYLVSVLSQLVARLYGKENQS